MGCRSRRQRARLRPWFSRRQTLMSHKIAGNPCAHSSGLHGNPSGRVYTGPGPGPQLKRILLCSHVLPRRGLHMTERDAAL